MARAQGLLKARGRQHTDSTHVVGAIRVLNRLERVGETLRAALNRLAMVAPAWVQAWRRQRGMTAMPIGSKTTKCPRPMLHVRRSQRSLERMGRRCSRRLTRLEQPWLREMPAVQTLRRVWAEQYVEVHGTFSWREVKDRPSPAEIIASPYDPEARYSTKRAVEWIGYKVHLTETCDPATPHLIVNVETTPATTPDDHMLAIVHASLEPRGLLPAEHLVDKGYTDSQVLVDSQRTYDVTVMGPVADDPSWQARTGTGVRQSAVCRRLGPSDRHVPDGQAEHLLAPEHLSPEWHDMGGALCPQRLHPVSPPGAMYAGEEGAPHCGTPGAGAV